MPCRFSKHCLFWYSFDILCKIDATFHRWNSNNNLNWGPYGTSDAQTNTHAPSCISVQGRATAKEGGCKKEVKSWGWWRNPVRERCRCAKPSHADLTSCKVRLTTGQGCLWLSHRRNGWKGLWCWSCSAWLQNENMELLVSQPMTAVGNH